MNNKTIIFPNNKILFIDDDTEVTDLMVQFFETTEFEVYVQNDSRLALKDVFDIMPFFVILDYNMPYMNGLEHALYEWVRYYVTYARNTWHI